MKKILILAYDFPPFISVGGLRPYSWHKFMSEFGFEAVVVTRQWSHVYGNSLDYVAPSATVHVEIEKTEYGPIHRAPFKPNFSNRLLLKYGPNSFVLLRKILSFSTEILSFLVPFGNKRTIFKAADKLLKEEKFDFILATGEPFIMLHFASLLSKKHKVPWVADYRDAWTNDIKIHKVPFFSTYQRWIEKRTVKSASLITAVSDFVLSKTALTSSQKSAVIPNGYDPELIEKVKSILPVPEVLTFSFAGSFYDWHPLEAFIAVFADFALAHRHDLMLVNFYGTNADLRLKKAIESLPAEIQSVFKIHPKMPNPMVLEVLSRSHVLVLFNYYAFMGTKIFEYIGLKRLILFCFSNDLESHALKKLYYKVKEDVNFSGALQQELIEKTQSGIIVEDRSDLKIKLEQILKEFRSSGQVECHSVHTEDLSRKKQVQILCEQINQLYFPS